MMNRHVLLHSAVLALAFTQFASAADQSWTAASGNWNTPGNWTSAVPGNADNAFILNADPIARTIAYDYTGPAVSLGALRIDNIGGGLTTLLQSANTLTATSEIIAPLGLGHVSQSGGLHNITTSLILGDAATANGSYSLSGGTFSNDASGAGPFGVTVGNLGAGSVNQTGGTFIIGSSSQAANLTLAASASSFGTYSLVDGDCTINGNLYVGLKGAATFTQASGNVTTGVNGLSGELHLGENPNSAGTYVLNDGNLNSQFQLIGYQGTGTFLQTGGVNSSNTFTVSDAPNALGTYNLQGGTLTVSSEAIGYAGPASMVHSGGLNDVGFLHIAIAAAAPTTYSLSGSGSITAGRIEIGGFNSDSGGAGTLAISGGSVTLSDTFRIFSHGALVFAAPGGTLDITSGKIIVDSFSPVDKSAKLASLAAAITSASANNWTGKGITSNFVVNDNSSNGTHTTTIALVDNADLGLVTYKNYTLTADSLIITRALLGDSNLDNLVDAADFDRWFLHVGPSDFTSNHGDFDHSGITDAADFDAWYLHVGLTSLPLSPVLPDSPIHSSPVPEPASLLLLSALTPLLVFRKRK